MRLADGSRGSGRKNGVGSLPTDPCLRGHKLFLRKRSGVSKARELLHCVGLLRLTCASLAAHPPLAPPSAETTRETEDADHAQKHDQKEENIEHFLDIDSAHRLALAMGQERPTSGLLRQPCGFEGFAAEAEPTDGTPNGEVILLSQDAAVS
jgi:hypothetical protein